MQVYQDNFSVDYVYYVSRCYRELDQAGVQTWVARALRRHCEERAAAPLVADGVVHHLLNIAYHVTEDDPPSPDIGDVVAFAGVAPRLASKLLDLYRVDELINEHTRHYHALVTKLVDWSTRFNYVCGAASRLVAKLSNRFPLQIAAAIRDNGRAGLLYARDVSLACLWELVPELLQHMGTYQAARDALGALQKADLPRFVRDGLFTRCTVAKHVDPPEFAMVLPIRCKHTMVYHMVEWGTVPHEHLALFEEIPPTLVMQIAMDYPAVVPDVAASYNWIRRRGFVMTMAALAKGDGTCDPGLRQMAADPLWPAVRRVAEFV